MSEYIVPFLEVPGPIVARIEPGVGGQIVIKFVNPDTGDDITIERKYLEALDDAVMKARRMIERCSMPGPNQTLVFTRGEYWFKPGKAPDLSKPDV